VRVALADDAVILREGLSRLLSEAGFEIVGLAADAEALLELLATGTDGVGYLLKERVSDLDDLTSSVNRVGHGGSVLDPAVVGELIGRRRQGDNPLERLTDREREVLALIAEGRSNHAIAERLCVTEHTIEKHVKNILGTLQLHNPRTTTGACSPSSPTSTRSSHRPASVILAGERTGSPIAWPSDRSQATADCQLRGREGQERSAEAPCCACDLDAREQARGAVRPAP
jgi:DNA-binding NarL/FixJ family response regulator